MNNLTPEEENRMNQNTDQMDNALNNFIHTPQQTLEDLIGTFSYLTMGDVEGHLLNRIIEDQAGPSRVTGSSNRPRRRPHCLGGSPPVQEPTDLSQTPSFTEKPHEPNSQETDVVLVEDTIEEEVLAESESTMSSQNAHRPKFTKFDNFVDMGDADIGDGEDLNASFSIGGYSASFLEQNNEQESGSSPPSWKSTRSVSPKRAELFEDLSSETFFYEMANFSDTSVREPACYLSEQDDLSEYFTPAPSDLLISDPSRDSASNSSSVIQTAKVMSSISTVDPELASCSAVTKLNKLTKSDENEISNFIQVQSLKQKGAPKISEGICAHSKRTNSQTCFSSENQPILLNPGEMEHDVEESKPTKDRCIKKTHCLNISTQPSDSTDSTHHAFHSIESGSRNQPGSSNDENEVVPFVLDADFDYDSVVLTPKFSAEEMAYLDSFKPA